ncbi:MAG: glycosyl hydrolase, partial [Rikenellaceae bacterium]|nr:glycosyl hydrolase [Rikenellaceae bacterium]
MSHTLFGARLMLIAAVFLTGCRSDAGTVASSMFERGFVAPPDSVKISTYWYWISGNVSKEGVAEDLRSMKAAGIDRAYIGNIGHDDVPYGPVELMSEPWWEILHTALKTATELDMEIGIFNSPGWSQSGGPWVKPEESMRYLCSSQVRVEGPSKFS